MTAQPTTAAVIFPVELQQQLIDHAVEGDPDEVCGILAGLNGQVQRVFRIKNTADQVEADRQIFRDRQSGDSTGGHKPVHYYMDPKDQIRVYNEIDDLELDVVGYYHSHTHTEARPSATDIRLSFDSNAYWVLVSLQDKSKPHVRVWNIVKSDPSDETGTLVERDITG